MCWAVGSTDRLRPPRAKMEVLSIIQLTLADITKVKLAERQKQEQFIDIFSHELRNLVRVALNYVDGVLEGVKGYQIMAIGYW